MLITGDIRPLFFLLQNECCCLQEMLACIPITVTCLPSRPWCQIPMQLHWTCLSFSLGAHVQLWCVSRTAGIYSQSGPWANICMLETEGIAGSILFHLLERQQFDRVQCAQRPLITCQSSRCQSQNPCESLMNTIPRVCT